MIKSFAHKGLKKFFETGNAQSIQAKHKNKLRLVLGLLDRAKTLKDIDFHDSDLHPLKGKRKGLWAVRISGNWRITFRFEDENVYIVDYVDYH